VKRLSVAILLAMTAGAHFSAAKAAPFEITDGWFRALPGKLPAGGYFTAYNGTGRDVSIVAADSDACGMLMMHQSSNKGGMSGMDMVDKVSVPVGGTVRFAPGGYHLMCENPTAKMKVGSKVGVLLRLSDGSAVAAGFVVKNAAGK
jgi:copper(I)-binding protein